jgi:Protein of unknown function (DUF2815)
MSVFVTPIFRVSFSHVWQPEKRDDGKKVWSVTGIFEEKDLAEMRKLAKECGLAKWPKAKGIKQPFRKGVDKDEDPNGYDLDKYPEYKGKVIVGLKSYNRPIKVVYNRIDPDTKQRVPIEDEEDFVSGCYARAAVSFFTYDQGGNKGVSVGITSLVKIRDGEPLINVADPTKDFAAIKTEELDEETEDDDL